MVLERGESPRRPRGSADKYSVVEPSLFKGVVSTCSEGLALGVACYRVGSNPAPHAIVSVPSGSEVELSARRRLTIAKGSRRESAQEARVWRGLQRAISWQKPRHD